MKKVTMNNWDDVRQDVSIFFDDYINMDNELEVCGNLSHSDILEFVTMKKRNKNVQNAHSHVCTNTDTL